MNCTGCNAKLELTEADPSVGIFYAAFHCVVCDESFNEDGEEI